MKFLQNKLTEKPKILELLVNFNEIHKTALYLNDGTAVSMYDCYQSRPLVEIDGYCEFDVIELDDMFRWSVSAADSKKIDDNIAKTSLVILTKRGILFNRHTDSTEPNTLLILDSGFDNLGSIFLPENQLKYPKLYEEALVVINRK
jgi:hypothetical protein